MKIDNEFTVSVPIERAWQVLTDLEGIAPCLPGAQLTGVDGEVYTGKVKIKVGPVISQYAGTAQFIEKDDVAHRAVIDAKGKDSRGAGNAAATISASLRADGPRTVVTVDTDLNISGKIAQFGSGMIKEVSAKLLGQFVQNLENKLLVPASSEDADSAGAGVTEAGAREAGAVGGGAVPRTAAAAPAAGIPEPAPESAPAAGSNGSSPGPRVLVSDVDPEALDLMSMAGSSVYKRAIPLVVAAAVAVAVIVYVVVK
jgi:carbon monoxide dehydrogenase subunit G